MDAHSNLPQKRRPSSESLGARKKHQDESSHVPSQSRKMESHKNPRRLPADLLALPDIEIWQSKDPSVLSGKPREEEMLWWKTYNLYNCSPHGLLPSGFRFEYCNDTIANGNGNGNDNGNGDESSSLGEQNRHIAEELCRNFNAILVCPVFQEQPRYIQYAIRLAVWHRVGFSNFGVRPSFEQTKDGIPAPLPDTLYFLTFMESPLGCVGKAREVSTVDLKTISDAWDRFAGKSGGLWKKLETYNAPVGSSNWCQERHNTWGLKKAYITAHTMLNANSNRSNETSFLTTTTLEDATQPESHPQQDRKHKSTETSHYGNPKRFLDPGLMPTSEEKTGSSSHLPKDTTAPNSIAKPHAAKADAQFKIYDHKNSKPRGASWHKFASFYSPNPEHKQVEKKQPQRQNAKTRQECSILARDKAIENIKASSERVSVTNELNLPPETAKISSIDTHEKAFQILRVQKRLSKFSDEFWHKFIADPDLREVMEIGDPQARLQPLEGLMGRAVMNVLEEGNLTLIRRSY